MCHGSTKQKGIFNISWRGMFSQNKKINWGCKYTHCCLQGGEMESEDVTPILHLYREIKCFNNMKAAENQNDSLLYSKYIEMIDNS